jgi:ATP-dependent DNA helicase RecG
MLLKSQAEPSVNPIRFLKGIGPKRAQALEKFGIFTLRDLLYLFPRRYEDRSQFRKIETLKPGDNATIQGEILSVGVKRLRGRFNIVEVLVGDESGALPMVWFNQPYLKNQFSEGQKAIFYGRVDFYQNRLQMNSPEYEIADETEDSLPIHTGRITPVYPLTEGLYQRSLRRTMKDLLDHQLENILEEFLPEHFRKRLKLEPLAPSIREMHFPSSFEALAAARHRLIFDELFIFELTLLARMERMKSIYKSFPLDSSSLAEFKKNLPFTLTDGQENALKEISEDLKASYPMNRLLQGDVGSGKTILAAAALFIAAKNNKQGVLLVPTEILAEQHYASLKDMFTSLKISAGLLTASTAKDKRERMIAELKNGKLSVLIGTHAMLQEDVLFNSLALIIIDEQHKFGVHQRCRLLERNPRPHQLVMTATPIPRTLALTVFGDMSTSTLKELPKGRKPIKTWWITRQKQKEILAHIREKLEKGEQAYFIFPMIEETEKIDLLAATKEYETLRKGAFSKLKVGLVHGRLSVEERESVMRAFTRNEIHTLVATSVIEVGVNNPNATVMVIENAERFGLAQLHQMRGRIGRGSKESECFLFGEPKTVEGQKRLRIMTKTQDGFLIAEEDLKLRGPGDFWGTRQSGVPLFKIANPIEDEAVLIEARREAREIVVQKKLEKTPEWAGTKKYLEQFPIRY